MERNLRTIVGGRAAAEQDGGNIPRGIEVLLKKAKVDAGFKSRFLQDPATAAGEIELQLTSNEQKILSTTPRPLLERMIENTFVPRHHVATFLKASSAAMLALILGSTVVMPIGASAGVREIPTSETEQYADLAQARMASIQKALEQFRADHGTYPSTELWEKISNPLEEYLPLAHIQDPWMRKFHYEAVMKETGEVVNYVLESLGPDPSDPLDNIPCPIDPELHRFNGAL